MFRIAEWRQKQTKQSWFDDIIEPLIILLLFLLFHYLNHLEFLLLIAKTIYVGKEDKICFLRYHQFFQPHSDGMYIKDRES